MSAESKFIVGTSGYSFADWVGQFYPPATRPKDMFSLYAEQFKAVELNFTFYRMQAAGTLVKLAQKSPADFHFWVKANRRLTHQPDRDATSEFLENLQPLTGTGKLAGVLLQFPQSFHRTIAHRKYLASLLEDLSSLTLAVEFRHCSWDHPSTAQGLGDREVALVVPDCPPHRQPLPPPAHEYLEPRIPPPPLPRCRQMVCGPGPALRLQLQRSGTHPDRREMDRPRYPGPNRVCILQQLPPGTGRPKRPGI